MKETIRFLFLSLFFIILPNIICQKKTNKKKKKKKFERDNSVIIMNDKNFEKIINSMDILVFYYAPWCDACTQFMPVYTSASLTLRDEKPKLNFGKIELESNPKTKEKYQIKGYPVIHYFKKGIPYNFTGISTKESLVKFMWKNNLPPVSQLETLAEISSFKNGHEITVIYFGSNKKILKILNDIAFDDADIFYGTSDFLMAFKTYNVKNNTIVLFKQNGDERTELSGKLTKDGIINFIKKNSFDKILEGTERTAKLIWGLKNPGLFLFINRKDEKSNYLKRIFTEVSEKLQGRIYVVVMGLEYPMEQQINTYTLVKPTDLPTIRIFDPRKGIHAFHLFNKRLEMNVKNIIEFVEKFETGRLVFFKLSEEIPQFQRGTMREIVAITFDKEVFYNHQHVLILFYNPYSAPGFQEAINIMESFAQKVKGNETFIYSDIEKDREGKLRGERVLINRRLNFGMLDLSRNDPDMRINYGKLPCLQLFLDEDKNHPFGYNGEISEENVLKWLEETLLRPDKTDENSENDKKKEEKSFDLNEPEDL